MSVNASWLRMFLEMRKRHQFAPGDALALGVQDVMFNHATAEALYRERGISPSNVPVDQRTYALSRNQKQFTKDPKHYMGLKDLYKMQGFNSLTTLDAFENDKPDIQWDLCTPIPKDMHNKYDVLFDIGVLEHTSDIFQAMENVANLVKVGGWIAMYIPMFCPINTCMFFPNPPFYFDVLARNGFHNFDAWINWMPDWDQQNDLRTIWLNFKYNDDVFIYRPRYYTIMFFLAQKREHVGDFKPVLQNFYQEWFAGTNLFATTEDGLLKKQGAQPAVRQTVDQRPRSGFGRSLLGMFGQQHQVASRPAIFPTAGSQPTPVQLARFPLGSDGLPYAAESVVAPVDSRPQLDIPEQMMVGSPPREQLYL